MYYTCNILNVRFEEKLSQLIFFIKFMTEKVYCFRKKKWTKFNREITLLIENNYPKITLPTNVLVRTKNKRERYGETLKWELCSID